MGLLLKLCDIHNIPLVTNPATIDKLIDAI